MATEPPSLRELELETLLRQREAQLLELTDEITHLRRYLNGQPQPSSSDPIQIPPSLFSILQSYIGVQRSKDPTGTSSSTVTAALVQRTRTLQEENDELYSLLQSSRTGQLIEEVQSLRKTTVQLSRALKDAQGTIRTLNDEVDKSYSSFLAHQEAEKVRQNSRSPPRAPNRNNQSNAFNGNGDMVNVPTGPRAHKKQRLTKSPSPSRSPVSLSLSVSNAAQAGPAGGSSRSGRRERSPRGDDGRDSPVKESRKDEDEDVKKARDRSRDRQRERTSAKGKDAKDRQHERDRGRDHRDRDRGRDSEKQKAKEKEEREREERSRRNGRGPVGNSSGGGNSSNRKGGRRNATPDDRTLRQRLGF